MGFDLSPSAGNEISPTPIIDAVAVQCDGKLILGGYFSVVRGVPRNDVARFNTDGTLDMAFNPDANGTVKSIAVLQRRDDHCAHRRMRRPSRCATIFPPAPRPLDSCA